MHRFVLRVVGLFIAAGALPAAWLGFSAIDKLNRLEGDVEQQQAQIGKRVSKEVGEQRIAESRNQMEDERAKRGIWLSVAAAALVVGMGLALLPSSAKTKTREAEPEPDEEDEPVVEERITREKPKS